MNFIQQSGMFNSYNKYINLKVPSEVLHKQICYIYICIINNMKKLKLWFNTKLNKIYTFQNSVMGHHKIYFKNLVISEMGYLSVLVKNKRY